MNYPASPDSFVLNVFESDGRVRWSAEWALTGRWEGKTRPKGMIWGVYTVPEVRGTGAGKHLMEDAIAQLHTLHSDVELRVLFLRG